MVHEIRSFCDFLEFDGTRTVHLIFLSGVPWFLSPFHRFKCASDSNFLKFYTILAILTSSWRHQSVQNGQRWHFIFSALSSNVDEAVPWFLSQCQRFKYASDSDYFINLQYPLIRDSVHSLYSISGQLLGFFLSIYTFPITPNIYKDSQKKLAMGYFKNFWNVKNENSGSWHPDR